MTKNKCQNKYLNIVDGAFEFLKRKCLFCEKQIKHNIFCDKICKYLFFEEKKEVAIRKYVSKKKYLRNQQIYNIKDILTEEYIAEMKKKVEKNIAKLMRERN